MNTLIIYDNSGYVYVQMASMENRIPQGGINYLDVEIPTGKQVISVDTTVIPHVPVLEDIPKTQEELNAEKIALMQKALDDLLLSTGGGL